MTMLIFEFYQEPEGSSFTHNSQDYDLNFVLKQIDKYPEIYFKVDDLKWVLKYDTPDPTRVEAAEIQYPVLVTYYGNRLCVIDGLHRLEKSIEEDKKFIVGKFVPNSILSKAKLQV